MSDTPIDIFIDLPSSPEPVQAGRLWSHFHHVKQRAFCVTPPSGDKKIACRHPGLAVSYKSRMAMVNYARAGVVIPTGAEVFTSSLG